MSPAASTSSASSRSALLGVWLGYVDSYSDSAARARVLIAVTESGDVHCVDTAARRTLWSRSIAQLDEDGSAAEGSQAQQQQLDIAEVSALINPHPMRINDSGVVVVAVRRHASRLAADDSGSGEVQSPASHFSYFAFSGRSGALRWRHASSDFLSPSSSSVSSASVLHEQHSVHTGEVEWRNYRTDFIAAMPHSWFSTADTTLALAQLTPPNRSGQRSTSKQAADKASSSKRAASRATQLLPSALSVRLSARQAHDDSEHLEHPNAIVAHTRDGIELLALYTGRPITHLPLDSHQTHADINADGVVDHLTVVHQHTPAAATGADDGTLPLSSASWQSQLTPCRAVVSSHIPPSAQLFNVSVCSSAVDQLLAIHFMQAAAGLRRARRPGGGRFGPPAPFLGRRHMRVGGGRTVRSDLSNATDNSAAAADSHSEREMVVDSDDWEQQQQDQPSTKQSAAIPLLLADTRTVSGGGGQPMVAFFLSSAGLLTGVDARGTKLFATPTTAQFAVSEQPSSEQHALRRVMQFDVKRDGSMVSNQHTIAHSKYQLQSYLPASLPAGPPARPLCCSWCDTLRAADREVAVCC